MKPVRSVKLGRVGRAMVGVGLVGVLALGMAGGATAQGRVDELQELEERIEEAEREQGQLSEELGQLDDEQSGLEGKGGDLAASLEGLDADIAAKVTQLSELQARLPGAQQALTDAEGRVTAAAAEVRSLNDRLQQAESSRTQILEEIAAGERELDVAHDEIGQIANQAYKQGGVSADLAFLLGVSDSSLPEAMGLANQALRIQNGRMADVAQETSTDRNAEARLTAVEGEIRDLRRQAEDALAREQQARDEAATAKGELDTMVADTSRLTDELKEQRPVIQAQLDANRQAQEQVNADIAERQRQLRAESSRQTDLQQQHGEAVAEAERARREAQEAARQAREAQERADSAAGAERRAAQADAQRAQDQADRRAESAAAAEQEAQKATSSSSWGLQTPVSTYMTSGFGWRSTPAGSFDYGGAGGYVHTGADFGGGCGIPVRASSSGEVWNADSAVWTAGNRVVISHGVVNGRALATKYHHLTRSTVSPGQRVDAGQVIGYTGSTGNSTGCHLHFETVVDGSPVDPMGLL